MKLDDGRRLNLVQMKKGGYQYVFVKEKPGEDDRLIKYLLTNNNKSYDAKAKLVTKTNEMGEEEQSVENCCLLPESMNTTFEDP